MKIPTIAPSTNFVAIYWFAWTIFTLQMTVAALKTSSALSPFLLTISNEDAGHSVMVKTRGWLGSLTTVLAWYTSAAGVINEAHSTTVPPVGPRS